MHANWHPVGCFFWPRGNRQEFSLMSGERSFLNLFRDSRTPLDSIWDKLVTLIYFVIVQCPSVGTTWYSASCAWNGYTWAARDLRLPRRTSGSALSADCQTLDVFVIVKVLFRIPQQFFFNLYWGMLCCDWKEHRQRSLRIELVTKYDTKDA